MSLRLEKSYGTWFREYRPIYTPLEAGITRYLKLDHDFIGRAAHEAEIAAAGPARRLVDVGRRARPGRPGRRHRRRADLARRRGRRLGHLRRLRPPRRASLALGYVPTALAAPDGPAARVRDRDHRPAPAGPAPAGAGVRSRRACGCASDRRAEPTAAGATGRIVVDGRPIAVRGGRLGRDRDPARRRAAGTRRHAVPGRRLRRTAWPRSTASPTCGPARRRPGPGCVVRAPSGGRAARRCPSSEPDIDRHAAAVEVARPPRRGRRRGHRRRRRAARPPPPRPSARPRRARARRRRRRRGRRRSTPDRRVVARTPTRDAPRPRRTRSSSRPAPPSSSRSARATGLRGLVTARAAERLHAAGVDLGARSRSARRRRRAVHASGRTLVRFEGDEPAGHAPSSPRDDDGAEIDDAVRHRRSSASAWPPRDLLARMAGAEPPVTRRRRRGRRRIPLPPPPTDGRRLSAARRRPSTTSRASGTRGFPSSSCSSGPASPASGTCQGGVCLPHVRAWIADRTGDGAGAVHRPAGVAPDHPRPRRPRTSTSTPSGARRCTTSTSRSARGWTASAAGGGRGTTATTSPSTGRSARRVSIGDVSTLGKLIVSGPGRRSSSWSGSTRATSRTSSPAARATRCCSTSAATSSTTG